VSELRARIVKGLTWSAVGAILGQVARLSFGVVLARLLTPEDFGLAGMVAVFTAFIVLLPEFGLGTAIVRSETLEDVQLSSVFWLNVAIGTLISLMFAGSSPLLARFYHEPRVMPLAVALAAGLFFSNLGVVHRHLLIRGMEFRTLAAVGVGADLVAGVSAIGFAMLGFGPWSLVGHSLLRSGLPVLAFWFVSSWRPSFELRLSSVRSMVRFGGNLTASNLVNYVISHIDNLLVGKFHGGAALGVYQKAYEIMDLPMRQISTVISRVMLSAMASIQNDHERSRRLMLRAVGGIALVAFPLQAFVYLTAEPLVVGLLGPQWAAVAPVLEILCPIGMLSSIGTTVGWIYVGQGRSDLMFKWQLASGVVLVAGILLGLPYGPIGVAAGYAMAMSLLYYPSFLIAGGLIGLRFEQVARAVAGSSFCTVLGGLVVYGVGTRVPGLPLLVGVALQWAAGATVFLLAARQMRLDAYEEAMTMLKDRLAKNTVDEPS